MDSFGDRMKKYELQETGPRFMSGLPIYARIDGKTFSKFTRGMHRPYDMRMTEAMVETTRALVRETHAVIGYCQSDEISLAWKPTDSDRQWFGGKKFKIMSVLSAMATAYFAEARRRIFPEDTRWHSGIAVFDCRAFQLPSVSECVNAFVWRELDATKNAVSMAAQHHFSHKSLQGMTGDQMQERLFQEEGINFNDYPVAFKRGTYLKRVKQMASLEPEKLAKIPEQFRSQNNQFERTTVEVCDWPQLTKIKNRNDVIFADAELELDSVK